MRSKHIAAVATLIIGVLVGPVCAIEPTPKTANKYLLLDSRIVESIENARLTVGTVRKHERNPLFGEDKPWEVRYDNLYGNVLYDREDGLYKIWYSPFIVDHSSKGMTIAQRNSVRYRPPRNREMGICYAFSRDGLSWEKPELNLIEFEGSKANNLVLRGPHGAGVFKDMREPDAAKRYKMFYYGRVLRYSEDGIRWGDEVPCPGIDSHGDTHNNMLWSPDRKQYVAFVRLRDGRQRIVGRTQSDDLTQWTKAVEVLRNNAQDQAYAMPVFRYGNVYLGLVAVFRTAEDRVHTELAWSPDTVTWHRVDPGTPLIGNSPNEGDYDWGCVYAADDPVVLDDEIRLYYGGSNGKHTGWRDGFLCLATLRPDGWAGFEQIVSDKPAVITTSEIPYDNQPISLTADVSEGGAIKASIVDNSGEPLSIAEPLTQTATGAQLRWNKPIESPTLRIRFEITGAKMYSFNVGDVNVKKRSH